MPVRDKIAITISPALLEQVERLRKRSGESRSAVFERALAQYLAAGGRAARTRQYADAYRRSPESDAEARQATARAIDALASEPWDATR